MEIKLDNVRTEPAQAVEQGTPGGLGKDEFLKLFMAQLSQQDPLNPLDDKAFIAQLAQFTALEQAIETNAHLKLLEMTQGAVVNAQATDLLGREIVASGSSLIIEGGAPPPLNLHLGGPANTASARILDEDGNLVRVVELGALAEGEHQVAWDGLDDTGIPLPDGEYSIEVTAEGDDGEPVEVSTRISGEVSGVTFESGSAELLVNGLRVAPADVIEVINPPTASTTSPAGG